MSVEPISPLHVLFDAQAFVKQDRGGVSRSFAELVAQFRAQPELGITASIDLSRTTNQHLLEHALGRGTPGRFGQRLLDVSERIGIRPRSWANGDPHPGPAPDIVHSTAYKVGAFTRRFAASREKFLHVVTVHDMIAEHAGNPHPGKRWFVDDADAVVCVSTATRTDLEDLYGALAKPVHVVHHGMDPSVFRPDGAVFAGNAPTVVFIGTRNGHKRLDVLLDALARMATPLELVLVGGPLSDAECARVADAGLTDRIRMVVHPSDRDMAAWLRGAGAYVSTSQIEGFGIPVIEAMACGTPTVLTDTPVYREVAHGAAMHFAEGDADSLARVLSAVLSNKSLQSELRSKALRRAAELTWARSAQRMASVYRGLAAAS